MYFLIFILLCLTTLILFLIAFNLCVYLHLCPFIQYIFFSSCITFPHRYLELYIPVFPHFIFSCCIFLHSLKIKLKYMIDADCLHLIPDKVKAILEVPEPTNATELKSYLGLLNYYGKCLQHLWTILHPLYSLLQISVT